MDKMDWGDIFDFVRFGNVGADQIDDCAYYLIIAPQNVVGSTIMTKLLEMVRNSKMFTSTPCCLACLVLPM